MLTDSVFSSTKLSGLPQSLHELFAADDRPLVLQERPEDAGIRSLLERQLFPVHEQRLVARLQNSAAV